MQLGKFQMKSFNYTQGLMTTNHLGTMFLKSPQKASNTMIQLLAYNRGKSLESFLSTLPVREFESEDDYYWDVVASNKRNIPLVEARDEAGTTITLSSPNVGANTTPFYLVFDEDWFAKGEEIVGNLNEVYIFRILENPKYEGTNVVYKVELMGGNTTGCPAERLLAGERFSVEYAAVESELSRGVGTARFSQPVSMRNEWSTIRIKYKVPGSKALTKKLDIGIPVVQQVAGQAQGRVTIMNTWMHYVDYTVEEQFSDYKNHLLAFGRSNRNSNGEYLNIGESGEVIKMGAGLLEQMEVANTIYYNDFSIDLIENALYELSESKLDYKDRHFILRTGERGAIQFHKAVMNAINSGWTKLRLDNQSINVVRKTTSPLNDNALTAGFQFTEFEAPNGVKISLEVDPLYDDKVRNKIQHPNGGVAFSYRYDILAIGTMDQPNIFKCQIQGVPEYRGYEWGFFNPFTDQTFNPNMSHDEDSATIHKKATLGICVLDPTRTMSLIPSILAE